MIATELAEKLIAKLPLKRLLQQTPTLILFLDKSAISAQVLQVVITEKNTMLTNILANKKMLLSICLVPILLNSFSAGHLTPPTVIGDSFTYFPKIGYQNGQGQPLKDTVNSRDADCCLKTSMLVVKLIQIVLRPHNNAELKSTQVGWNKAREWSP